MIRLLFSKLLMRFYRTKHRNIVYKTSAVRKYFEYRILPHFRADKRFQRILIVGIAEFTQHYSTFFKRKEFVRTIDTDPEVTSFSSEEIHIVDSIENIDQYVDDNCFDLILMNGVYGWGLSSEKALQKSLEHVHKVMKPDGVLLFGWNEMEQYDPLNIRSKNYFHVFTPYMFNGKSEIKIPPSKNPKQHVFSFYKK